MDAFVGAWCLLAKLVAGEVEDIKALSVVFLIECLKFVILRGESALCGCIDDKQNLVSILFQGNVGSLSVFDREIINCFHFPFEVFVEFDSCTKIIKVNEECDTTNKELLNFNHLYLALRDFPTEEYGFFLWRFGVFALSLHRKQEVKPFNV